jgi:protein TonB
MTRNVVSLTLSVILHVALLSSLSAAVIQESADINGGMIRVVFHASGRGAEKAVPSHQNIDFAALENSTLYEKTPEIAGFAAEVTPEISELTESVPDEAPSNIAAEIIENTLTEEPRVKIEPAPESKSETIPLKPETVPKKEEKKSAKRGPSPKKAAQDAPQPKTGGEPRGNAQAAAAAPKIRGGEGGEKIANAETIGGVNAESGRKPAAMSEIVDISNLKVIKKISPDYPMISKKRHEEGRVVLLAKISSNVAVSVKIESSSGHAPLDESAIRAVKKWRFETPIGTNEIIARIPFTFEIR